MIYNHKYIFGRMDAKYDSIMFFLIKILFIKEDFFNNVIY